MSGPRVAAGVRVPLFDRLVGTAAPDDLGYDGHDRRMLDRAGLLASIGRELARLLNTRTSVAIEDLDRWPRTTLTYGLPNLSWFWPRDDDSEKTLAAVIQRTIAAFEPRLLAPRVTVERVAGRQRVLRAVISGNIALGAMIEPVTFPILVDESTTGSRDG